ncbi:MAG: alcohol dehydrogenase catalytic domain-containing protein [Chloroflexia bacterium]|nr:alcohol dehydrogenase catalytic domain-containing protein [Chloroflexia bacterium]
MRYSQLIAPRTSAVVAGPTPEPGPGEVLVQVTTSGVCASELHPWTEGRPPYPHRFGHEPMGVVAGVGPGVTRVREGDRVTGIFNEAYAEFGLARESGLLPVPPNVRDENALGEPLACLVNALRRTPVALADRVALIGLGYMGLGMLQLLKLRGPSRIVAIDVREEARAAAKTHGATEVSAPAELPPDSFLTSFGDWQSDRGFEVVIEASGTQAGLTLAGELVRPHGVLSILGYHQGGPRTVDVGMWNWKAIDVVNAHVRRRADLMASMRIGLELAAKGLIDLGSLVTHRYTLDEVDRAYTDLETKPEGFIKGVVRPWDEGDGVMG